VRVWKDRAVTDRRRKLWILVACILGSVIAFLDSSVVNVALPAIEKSLGGGLVLQQWVVDAYLLTLGSLILIGGSLVDLYGSKRVFIWGTGAFGVTSVICAIAQNGTTLIVSRGFQGIAGAVLVPASLATITGVFAGEERGAAIGRWTAWTGIAFILGPLTGGWLISISSWRAIFLINVPLVIVAIAIAMASFPPHDPEKAHARVDVIGGLLCIVGLGAPVFALIEEQRRGWSDPVVLVSLIGGLAVFGLFIWYEARASHPMLPLRLFRRRNFSWANIETFTVYAALSVLTFFLIIFLQQLAGYSALQAGLATAPITLVMFVLSPRFGRLSMRFGPRWFMGLGPLVCAAAIIPFFWLTPDFSYAVGLLGPLIVFSVGLSMIVAPLTSTVLADAGPADAGIASGVNNAVARVAGLLGIALAGVAIAGPENLDLGGFHLSMEITAGLLVVGGAIGLVGIRNQT
jgi:EmrB/QacA subfamily drug resistance transporter